MHIVDVARRRVLGLCLCGTAAALAGCGIESQKVMTMPVVTEESLSPEQKAALKARQKQQADLMRRVGITGPMSPQEFARQRMEEVKAQQTAENDGAAAGDSEQ